MKTKQKQQGYIDYDLHAIFILAVVGMISAIGGGIWLIYWLIKHVRIVLV